MVALVLSSCSVFCELNIPIPTEKYGFSIFVIKTHKNVIKQKPKNSDGIFS